MWSFVIFCVIAVIFIYLFVNLDRISYRTRLLAEVVSLSVVLVLGIVVILYCLFAIAHKVIGPFFF